MIQLGSKSILVKKGNITEEKTDAIVNPANSQLMHGGGAARAIALKGGAEIQRQSNDIIRKIGRLPVGKAVITDAGELPCKFVIHTVGPQWGEGNEPEKLEKAIRSTLILAELYNLKSISLPAVSSGIFGFPKERCAQIMFKVCCEFLKQRDVRLEEVVFCNYDQETYRIFLDQEDTILRQQR